MMAFQSVKAKSILALLAGANVALSARDGLCPPLGPVLPAPKALSSHDAVKKAIDGVSQAFGNVTSKYLYAGVSVQISSLHEEDPLVDLHFTPPNLDPRSTKEIDADSVYRIGSISKVFNVLSVLTLGKVRWDDRVVDFVPELLQLQPDEEEVNDITTVRWSDVTIGSLASHMSGIGTDLVNDLSSFPGIPFTQAGLPEIDPAQLQGCAGVMGLPSCTRDQFFRDFGKRHPVFTPYTSPVYSNVASTILGFVVEAVSGKPYADYLQEAIFTPAGLTSTTVHSAPADNTAGFVPVNETWWGGSLGYEDSAGGLYSSTNDIQALGRAILSSSLLSPAQTRKWMKPQTGTSSMGMLVGGPWEILRSTSVTKDQRLIEYYCKAGNLNAYNNMVCLIPDYDLVITILSGGKESGAVMVDGFLHSIITTIVPAIEEAGKTEAATNFAGTYIDEETNSTIVLRTDDGPGFEISNWQVRDVPTLKALNFLKSGGSESTQVQNDIRVRLYPSNTYSYNSPSTQSHSRKREYPSAPSPPNTEDGTYKQSWRAVFDMGSAEQLATLDKNRFWPQASCHTWTVLDRFVYQFRGIDDFVFSVDAKSGKATELELRGFKVTLKRQE